MVYGKLYKVFPWHQWFLIYFLLLNIFHYLATYFTFYYRLANFEGHLSTKIQSSDTGSGLNEYVENLFDKNLTWKEVKWLKR